MKTPKFVNGPLDGAEHVSGLIHSIPGWARFFESDGHFYQEREPDVWVHKPYIKRDGWNVYIFDDSNSGNLTIEIGGEVVE